MRKFINWITSVCYKFFNCLISMKSKHEENKFHGICLIPESYPQYNSRLVKILNEAINQKELTNIALTGGYGIGKSSILKQLIEDNNRNTKRNIKVISFLSFSRKNIEEKHNDKYIKQEFECKDKIIVNGEDAQREILRQFILGAKANKLRRSNFVRTGRGMSWASRILIFILISLAVFYLKNNFFYKIFLNSFEGFGWIINSIAIFFSVCLTAQVDGILGRASMKSLKFPFFGVSGLEIGKNDKESMNSIEMYSDELIYVFKEMKYEIVIFEDIDRLNDINIFEVLRQLNCLLNSSEDIKHKVTFIYAVRDDLISSPMNMVKLFDYILPAVPFLTIENAGERLWKTINKILCEIEYDFDPWRENVRKILDLFAIEASDERLIRFFVEMVRVDLPMMISKNTNPTQVLILFGIRILNPRLYDQSRRGEGALMEIKDFCDKNRNEAVKRERTKLGAIKNSEKAIEEANRKVYEDKELFIIDENGNEISKELADESAWRLAISNGENGKITLKSNNYYRTNEIISVKDIFEDLDMLEYLTCSDPKYWQDSIIKRIGEISTKMNFDYYDKYRKSEDGIRFMTENPFVDKVLIKGLMNEDFLAYMVGINGNAAETSITVRSFSANYIMRDKPNYSYPLTKEECKKILKNRDIDFSKAIFNFSIFEYIFEKYGEERARSILEWHLVANWAVVVQFIMEYFQYRCWRDNSISRDNRVDTKKIDGENVTMAEVLTKRDKNCLINNLAEAGKTYLMTYFPRKCL